MTEPLEPPTGPPPSAPSRQGNPWDRRRELGLATAFGESLKQLITDPRGTFEATLPRGDLGGALLFAIIVGWIGIAVKQLWTLMTGPWALSMMPPEMREQMALWMGATVGSVLLTLVVAPILILIGLFISGAILHLVLLLIGGTDQSDAGFEGTLRVVSFAGVAHLAQLVPVAGGIISLIWSVVLLTLGLASLHRTTQGKALAAVLIPLLVCCLGFVLIVLVAVGSMAAIMSH